MINSIAIKNFKGIKNFNVINIPMVTIVGGYNNVGKTTLLEALLMLNDRRNLNLIFRLLALRKVESIQVNANTTTETICSPLFLNYNTENNIVVSIDNKEKIEISLVKNYHPPAISPVIGNKNNQLKTDLTVFSDALKLEYSLDNKIRERYHFVISQEGPRIYSDIPITKPQKLFAFISANSFGNPIEDSNRFSQLDIIGKIDSIVEIIREIEPRIKSLSIIAIGNLPMIHGDIGIGRKIPMNFMGEGTIRLLSIILAIAVNKNGMVLIDEFENGIHYSKMPQIWRIIAKTAKEFNCQIITTTHSYECISAAHRAFKDDFEKDLSYIRLERENEEIISKSYSYNILASALENEMEVR